jgi:hypothetical protein
MFSSGQRIKNKINKRRRESRLESWTSLFLFINIWFKLGLTDLDRLLCKVLYKDPKLIDNAMVNSLYIFYLDGYIVAVNIGLKSMKIICIKKFTYMSVFDSQN